MVDRDVDYTVYECRRCKDRYRKANGAARPGLVRDEAESLMPYQTEIQEEPAGEVLVVTPEEEADRLPVLYLDPAQAAQWQEEGV